MRLSQPNMVMWEIFIPSAEEESLFDLIATAAMCEYDIVTISSNDSRIEWGHKSLNSGEFYGMRKGNFISLKKYDETWWISDIL